MREFPKTKKEILNILKNVSLIVAGTFVLAFGSQLFIFPFDLVTGGVSGIGIIFSSLLSNIEALAHVRADTYASIANWILFVLGYFLLGRSFAAKTLISTVVYPVALWLTRTLMNAPFFNLNTYVEQYGSIVLIIATVFGGACIGAGCALTFMGGGSTGGVDVIALTLSKYSKRLKSSVALFICDAVVITLGVFAIDDIVLTLLGITSALVCAISIDKIFLGESSAFIAHIVSDKYLEINDAVIKKLDRTTTIVDAVGGYSGQNKKMVIVTFSMRQYVEFTAMISSIDKTAFVMVHRAHEINGEDWTYTEKSGGNQS